MVIMGWAALILSASSIYAQTDRFTNDFETGDLRGWQARGVAFRNQPTLGDNPTARNRNQPSRHQGKWWIGTFERYQGRERERAGSTQGDKPQGTLQSAEFTVPAGSLTFLIGGGASFETRVELIVLNEGGDPEFNQIRAFQASGRNTETMHRVTWDLTEYEGRQGFVRIVDASSAGWGHINADDFRFMPRLQVISPGSLTRVPPGTMTREDPEPILVPDLLGKNLQQAREIIQESGLETGNVQSVMPDYMKGPVIRQSPAPGTEVSRGSRLVLVLGGPPQVRVPNIIGLTEPDASRALKQNRLSIGARRELPTPDHREDTVIEQNPPPGTEVTIGNAVDLVIAVRPKIVLVPVPDLSGMTLEQAEPRLARLRLGLGKIASRFSEQKENIIFRQDPPPGRRVEIGTLVNVVIAARERVDAPPIVEEDPPASGERVAPGTALNQSVAVAKSDNFLWPIVSTAALILFGVGALLLWKKPAKAQKLAGDSPQAELEITPSPDPGRVRVESDQPLDQDFELRLRAVGDPGRQEIKAHDGLIEQESKKP